MKRIFQNRFRFLLFLISLSFFVNQSYSQEVLKIMPLGNSITEGWDITLPPVNQENYRVGYRKKLKDLLTTAGYTIDYVGSENYGSAIFTDGDFQNAGVDGTRDQYLLRMMIDSYDERWNVKKAPWPGPYLDYYKPDIILFGIGTNDITHESDAIANQKVSAILDQVDLYEARSGKEVWVYLQLIINRAHQPNGRESQGTWTTTQWNNAIKSMAINRITNGDKIVIVDMENGAGLSYLKVGPAFDFSDTLHPNSNGYNRMANKWMSSFTYTYNTAPVISQIPNQFSSEGIAFDTLSLNDYVSDIEDAAVDINWSYTQLGPQNLNISNDGNNKLSIVPINPTWFGTQTVIFTATDNGAANGLMVKSDMDTVVFTISEVYEPPVVVGQDSLFTNEDNPLFIKLSDLSITDPDSDPSTFHLNIKAGTNYTFNGDSIIPAADFNGYLIVIVSVDDQQSESLNFPLHIKVVSVNDAPKFIGQNIITIDEDSEYLVKMSDLNFSDVDNTTNELSLNLIPNSNCTVEGNLITPVENFNGELLVEANIQDLLGAHSSTFYLLITINAVNDLPYFTTTPLKTVNVGSAYIYSFATTDPDTEDTLSYAVLDKPSWLTYLESSNVLAGQPQAEDVREWLVTIEVNDGSVNNVYQTFVIKVIGPDATVNFTKEKAPHIYPNPIESSFTIVGVPGTGRSSLAIFDMYGRKVVSIDKVIDEKTYSIQELELSPGIYFYSIQIDQLTFNGKLLISH